MLKAAGPVVVVACDPAVSATGPLAMALKFACWPPSPGTEESDCVMVADLLLFTEATTIFGGAVVNSL